MSSRSRLIRGMYLIFVGLAFSMVGVITLGDPRYWDATTPFDYAAVWAHSLVLLLVAPALLILVRLAEARRAATVVAWIVAAGAVVASAANAIEDGFHLKDFGTLYVIGAILYAYGMPLLALLLALGKRKGFALVPALTFVGLLAYEGGGGILIGATWAVLGLLVMTGRAEPGSTGEEPSPAEPEPA